VDSKNCQKSIEDGLFVNGSKLKFLCSIVFYFGAEFELHLLFVLNTVLFIVIIILSSVNCQFHNGQKH
jgi:hypothetical protein